MSPAKKRKHAAAADDARGAKKRKHRERRARVEFARVDAGLVVAVPPVFAAAPAHGVLEMLDSMLMRYIPPLRGVVLAHSDLRFLDATAHIPGDSPFAVCRVAFRATVWSPRVGQRLTGRITLSSPDHVALLVHRTFNAAIPAAHVPRDEWEFVPGPAEDVEMADADAGADADADDAAQEPHTTVGHWVHARTREPLGGPARTLAFTVVGLTIANQMLSLVGSIRADPFAPAADAAAEAPAPAPAPAPEPEPEAQPEAEPAGDGEDDLFAALGRTTDAATQRTKRPKRRERDAEAPRRKKHKHRAREGAEPGRKEEP